MNRFALALSFALAFALACGACNSASPPRGPEETCARACEARGTRCTREECWRGCNTVIDRLAEHEGEPVLACVATETSGKHRRCDDRLWAWCATRIGPHADGGPPAPPPPPDFDDFEDNQ